MVEVKAGRGVVARHGVVLEWIGRSWDWWLITPKPARFIDVKFWQNDWAVNHLKWTLNDNDYDDDNNNDDDDDYDDDDNGLVIIKN